MSTVGAVAGPYPCEPPIALVVEHDPWIRLVLCDVLAQAGFRVVSASNGFSAVRLARREPLALVVLDLVLPELSGLSVLAELKATPATAQVPVIVIKAAAHCDSCHTCAEGDRPVGLRRGS